LADGIVCRELIVPKRKELRRGDQLNNLAHQREIRSTLKGTFQARGARRWRRRSTSAVGL
jgi:hypothetical protein